MTPAARAAAAILILDEIRGGAPAEAQLTRWARASRFAGSGDRAAVRDLVYETLRRRRSRAALGGGDSGRALILGALREAGADPATIFDGSVHGPAPLSTQERDAGRPPTATEALDLPDWILQRFQQDLGDDFARIAAAMRERAPVWLRVNLARATALQAQSALAQDGIGTETDLRCETALRITTGERRLQGSTAWREGLVEPQDLSPQIACAALKPAAGTRVLDLCAGGGGKALALAAYGAQVTAWDAAQGRMRDLPRRAERAGARIALADAAGPRGLYDLVVADVPCSGSGTWRRTPDAKWRLSPDDLAALERTQTDILARAATHVRPGGTLAYMTCSLLHSENEAQVRHFLDSQPDFRLKTSRRMSPLTESDGFFLAVFGR